MPSWFPFHYRDAQAWRSEGLPLTTPSDEAAKAFDAAVAQFVLADEDPQIGSMDKAMERAKAADPDFAMGKILACGLEAMGCNILKSPNVVKKIYDLKEASKSMQLSSWEQSHLEATIALADDDYLTACQVWEDILVEHPKDVLALNLLFFGHLHSGRRRFLRDSVHRVVNEYDSHDRYHGNVHGKLCFGFVENGQFDLATRAGEVALAHSPRDAWAVHSVAHIYEETLRPKQGIDFLQRVEEDWAPNNNLSQHIWWHKSLYFLQMEEIEEVLTLFDNTVSPRAVKCKMSFPLSDATSLLLRLQMEDAEKDGRIPDLKDRWRELGAAYADLADSVNNVFYDFHALVALLFGGQRQHAEKLRDNIREQASLYGKSRSLNCEVARRLGVALADATVAFAEKDFERTVNLLNPVRFEVQELLGGSHAQKDVVDLLLLRAAVAAGRRGLAGQLLQERVARFSSVGNDQEEEEGMMGRLRKSVLAH